MISIHEETKEKNTIIRRPGKLSETKDERFEREKLQFFPSQEPPNQSAGRQICSELEDLVEGASEGEAPETITAAAGLSQSQSLASKAARAVERYSFLETVPVGLMSNLSRHKVAATQKRKERDIRLKFQAQSRKRNAMELDLPSDTIENAPTGDKINDNVEEQNPISALLPESILLVEPAGPVFKSHPTSKKSDSNSQRLISLIAVPPKDLKQGVKTVRILESHRVLLPPRSALCGKTLRESWIFGRRSRGRDCNGVVPRRKMGNGFVRTGGL